MNTAGSGQHEARWILSTDLNTVLDCPPELDPLLVDFCSLGAQIGAILGNQILYEVRNRAADPYVGPLGEGAGKLNVGRALAALRDGVVVYSAASGSGQDAGTGPKDLQGSWQIGATTAGATHTQRFVVHAAPGAPRSQVRFSFVPGNPSDGSRAITAGKSAWSIDLPSTVNVSAGRDEVVTFKAKAPGERRSRPLHGHRRRHGLERAGAADPRLRIGRAPRHERGRRSRRRSGDRRVRGGRVREVRHDLAVRGRSRRHGRRLRLARLRGRARHRACARRASASTTRPPGTRPTTSTSTAPTTTSA